MITTNYTLQPIELQGQYEIGSRPKTDKPTEVTPHHPCPYCGQPDWCYSIGELTVWNRDRQPASEWEQTEESDRFHQPNYALGQPKESPTYVLSNCQKLNNVQGGIA
ncbi:hypothetical protein [Nostoc sp. WHI]|uniref:hypothetical protein n=1 Tax=Nostoc sp. WHI TaxID=2650611 RepID=UPI0018C59DFC|nr:hypothetical protein [Nostoc sp. WHI]